MIIYNNNLVHFLIIGDNILMEKMTNRAKQAEKTKKKIFKVGMDLLRKKGFDDVSITDIVKKANVGIGTFYHYYESKMDLFMDLYRDGDKLFKEDVSKMVEGKNAKESLTAYFKEYCNLVEKDGIEIVSKIYIPENTLFITEPRPMYDLLLKIVEEHKDELKFSKEMKPREICDEIMLIARGVVFDWALHKGSYDIYEKMNKMISVYY